MLAARLASPKLSHPSCGLSRPTSHSKFTALRRVEQRSYAKDSKSGADEEPNANRRTQRESPTRSRTDSPIQPHLRSALSILSPLNRTAVLLGRNAVLVFSGSESTGDRFTSWPYGDSCCVVPPGTSHPVYKKVSITGTPTVDILNLYQEAKATWEGKETGQRMHKAHTSGDVKWLVEVGDLLVPNSPILRIGDVTFLHQPPYKSKETPNLYVANFLLRGHVLELPPARPLLVAVYDLAHLPRFEHFEPTPDAIKMYSTRS